MNKGIDGELDLQFVVNDITLKQAGVLENVHER